MASRRMKTSDLSAYEKLMLYLGKRYPNYSKDQLTDALRAYRQEQGTLAGLSLKQIEEGVLNAIENKYPSKQVDNDTTQTEAMFEESVAAALWSTFKRYRERGQSLKKSGSEDKSTVIEDQCLICLENLSSKKTETFDCQHVFHRDCLIQWFEIERTCPLCRKLLLFKDEFPSLK